MFPSLTIMLETGEIKRFPMVGGLRLVLSLCRELEVKQRKEVKRVDIKGEISKALQPPG
jgi:hypothetical protein